MCIVNKRQQLHIKDSQKASNSTAHDPPSNPFPSPHQRPALPLSPHPLLLLSSSLHCFHCPCLLPLLQEAVRVRMATDGCADEGGCAAPWACSSVEQRGAASVGTVVLLHALLIAGAHMELQRPWQLWQLLSACCPMLLFCITQNGRTER